MNPLPAGPHSVRTWRPIAEDRHLHRGRNASRLLQDEDGNVGLFKWVRGGGHIAELYALGIEWIAYALGTVLGVPVAPTYILQYSGITGTISPLMPNARSWKLVHEERLGPKPLVNADLLPLSVVFDVWIANCDRWPPNLLVSPEPPTVLIGEADAWRYWLIDHGYCFLWPPVKYGLAEDGSDLEAALIDDGDTQTENAIRERITDSSLTRGYWGALANLSSAERVPLFEKVKAIPDETIDAAVCGVPGAYMNQRLMELTLQQIKARRDRIDQLVDRLT